MIGEHFSYALSKHNACYIQVNNVYSSLTKSLSAINQYLLWKCSLTWCQKFEAHKWMEAILNDVGNKWIPLN